MEEKSVLFQVTYFFVAHTPVVLIKIKGILVKTATVSDGMHQNGDR